MSFLTTNTLLVDVLIYSDVSSIRAVIAHCKKCLQPAVLTAQPNGSIITHSSEIDVEVSKKVCNQARFSAANTDTCSQAKLMCVS